MKEFQRGQIWLVNFEPSFGHEYRKVRPALIIEDNAYIDSSPLLSVVPISSQVEKTTSLDYLLRKDSQNRLMKDSLVKIKQISSFDKKRFLKFIGKVMLEDMEAINKNLCLYLGL